MSLGFMFRTIYGGTVAENYAAAQRRYDLKRAALNARSMLQLPRWRNS